MTLEQYLGTVAWLFIAFLMWFSVRKREQCNLGYGLEMYALMKKVKMKPVFCNLSFGYYVLCPSFFWAIVLAIWIDSINKLLA